MPITATISILPISNGFIVSDATSNLYGDSQWNTAVSVHYATLDDLAADMPRFVKLAVESATERDRQFREQLATEQSQMSDARNTTQSQRGAPLGRVRMPGGLR